MKISTPNDLKNKLFSVVDNIFNNKEKYLKNPETNFSRTQKISFQDTMLFPMTLEKEALNVEILDLFNSKNLPTAAAVGYRRDCIDISAFVDLFKEFTESLEAPNHIKGMLLYAVDGSRINTPYNPKDADSFSNSIEGRRGFNQYHLNTMYDLLNNQYVDCLIQGQNQMNEQAALCKMMDSTPKDKRVLITADRGYGSFNVFAHALNNGLNFVIRIKESFAMSILKEAKLYSKSESFDIEGTYYVGRKNNIFTKTLQNYHYLRPDRTYDYIPLGSDNIDEFYVRVVEFQLSDNTAEYLITNLTKEQFSLEELKDIYNRRWGIETSYRYLKYSADLIYVHSLKQNFIFQEIYSKLTLYNYALASVSEVKDNTSGKGRPRKHKQKINVTYHIKVCIRFLKGAIREISEIIGKLKAPVRAGRTYQRHVRAQHAESLQHR